MRAPSDEPAARRFCRLLRLRSSSYPLTPPADAVPNSVRPSRYALPVPASRGRASTSRRALHPLISPTIPRGDIDDGDDDHEADNREPPRAEVQHDILRAQDASAGVKSDTDLEVVAYVKNVFDTNPKLAIDRERGLRARFGYLIGQPRTIGMTVRITSRPTKRHRHLHRRHLRLRRLRRRRRAWTDR